MPTATMPTAMASNEALFSQLDQNRDGQLQADEIESQHRRLFDRLLRTADQDRNGQLSEAEFQTGLQPKQAAKPLVKKPSSEIPGANALLLLLAKMDVNGDGRVEVKEVPKQFRELFHRIEDRLGGEPDGVLDRRELSYAAPKLSQLASRMASAMNLDVDLELALLPEKQWQAVQNMVAPQRRGELLADPQQALKLFKRLDANNDGQVSRDEVPSEGADRFEMLLDRADGNRDDQLSRAEVMAMSGQLKNFAANRPAPADLEKNIKRLLKRLDRNGDGKISRQEAPPRMADRFARLDRDNSGQLDRQELTLVVELLGRVRRPEAKPAREAEPRMVPE